MMMRTRLPIEINYSPLTRLALINFEKNPDSVYSCLELQYMEGETLGKGYRVIAYRNDKYVDVYDEPTIKFKPEEKFDVAQKGLKQHVQTKFENTSFDKQQGKVHMSFTFEDCDHRKIEVDILEHTKRKSTPMNLLAPIGLGSEAPSYLPLFFLYEFDFIRRGKTDAKVIIDGKQMRLDPFPFPMPMNLQWRYYTRYSPDCQIVRFLSTDSKQIKEVDLKDDLIYAEESMEYQFELVSGSPALSNITLKDVKHPLHIKFEPALSLDKHSGEFHILPEEQMGRIDGSYVVTDEGDAIKVKVVPDKGWTSVPNSKITKMILGKKSIFCNWSKKYSYEQVIHKADWSTERKWTNGNI